MTDQTPSPSALYQRANRLKKKLKAQEEKDIIEKQQIAQAKKISQVKKQQKNADWDFEGRDPESNLVPQYQNEGFEQYDLWGRKEGIVNPLSKISYAQNLKALFGDHAE